MQWAKIILIIEQTMTTEARRHQQQRYSQPMKDQKRRALPFRWDRREGMYNSNKLKKYEAYRFLLNMRIMNLKPA